MTETIVDLKASLTKTQYNSFLAAVKKHACLKYLTRGSYETQRKTLQENLDTWLRASGRGQAEASAEAQNPQGTGGGVEVASASATGALVASPWARRLANFANNCYANASFQMLYDMELLRDFLVNLPVATDYTFKEKIDRRTVDEVESNLEIVTQDINDQCSRFRVEMRDVIKNVCDILRDMKQRIEKGAASPYSYRHVFRKLLLDLKTIAPAGRPDQLVYGNQEDAHEFLQRLLTILACIPGFDFTSLWKITQTTFPVGHPEYPMGKNSEELSLDVFLTLSVPYLHNDAIPSIQDCIDLEKLPEMDENDVSHAYSYKVIGEYCVIMLVRHATHGRGEHSRQYKLGQPVRDYEADVIIGSKRLTLTGVVTQLGGVDSGHYVYSHKTGDGWISYNDAEGPVESLDLLEDAHRPKYGYIFVYAVTENSSGRGIPTIGPPLGSISVEQYVAGLYEADEAEAKAKEPKQKPKPKARASGRA